MGHILILVSRICFLLNDLRNSVEFSKSRLFFIAFQSLSLIELPDEFLELRKIAKQCDSSSSVHEGGFKDPKIAVTFSKESFGASWFAVEVSLAFFSQLLS